MTTQITLNLSDEVYKRAQHFAQLTNRNVADVLAQAIALSLSPISGYQQVGIHQKKFDLARYIQLRSHTEAALNRPFC